MNIQSLLSVFSLLSAVECRNWWNIINDLLEIALEPEDAHLNITQLAFKYGYRLEEHQVVTEDGFIIKFHRIPNLNKPVVFLMHGITESSDSWLLQGPSSALAYVLANEGFDVWLGNSRGNKYSTEHVVYNYTSPEFWHFTWEEIGVYDLPAMIDYILKITERKGLYYIGHSQGTTSGYVLLSMKPEYNDKIKLMFSLAPEAWMSNVKSTLIKTFSSAANELSPYIDHGLFSTGTDIFNQVSTLMCSWFPSRCENLLYTLIGPEHKINDTLWSVIFGHMPTGSSTLQFVHYGQLVNTARFCRFDHGEEGNMELYGQATPPDYDLSNIVAPVVLYYSDSDWLSDPKDVRKLMSKLPNLLDHIFLSDFGHMDYVYSADARSAIYDRIIAQIKKFETDGVHT